VPRPAAKSSAVQRKKRGYVGKFPQGVNCCKHFKANISMYFQRLMYFNLHHPCDFKKTQELHVC